MRVYISGAITGVTDYAEKFQEAEDILKRAGYEVVNPAKVGECFPPMTWEEYMKVCIAALSVCDAIYMIPGWKASRGAKMEKTMAEIWGLKEIK